MNLKNTLLALLLMGGMISCVKAPENDDVDTTPDAVLESVSDTWGSIDPFGLKVNEFVSFATTQKVETLEEPLYTLREGLTVSERTDTEENDSTITRYKFNYQFDITRRNRPNTPQSTKEAERGYCRGTCTSAAVESNSLTAAAADFRQKNIEAFADDAVMVLGFERAGFLAGACFNSDAEQAECVKEGYDSCERKCVNLKTEEIMRPVPDQVKAQPNCGGYENCMWRTKIISVDLIQTYKKGAVSESLRASFWATFVPELPFLARLTDFCIRQMAPTDMGKILVNTCTSLTNYKPAPALPTP